MCQKFDGKKKIMANNAEEEILYYFSIAEVFDIIDAAHSATGHGRIEIHF